MSALHRRIATDLAGQIRSGAWPPGHRLPIEQDLAADYRCSRATANKAVNALRLEGLVERRRKAGTFVARPHLVSAALKIPDIRAEIESRGMTWRWTHILTAETAPVSGQDGWVLGEDAKLLEVRGLHFADDTPFALERRLINLAEVPTAADVDFVLTAPGPWLLSHVAWSEAKHEIAAVNPDADEAHRLGISRHVACLALKRWTWRAWAGITFARQLFPGHEFELAARFTPGGAL